MIQCHSDITALLYLKHYDSIAQNTSVVKQISFVLQRQQLTDQITTSYLDKIASTVLTVQFNTCFNQLTSINIDNKLSKQPVFKQPVITTNFGKIIIIGYLICSEPLFYSDTRILDTRIEGTLFDVVVDNVFFFQEASQHFVRF